MIILHFHLQPQFKNEIFHIFHITLQNFWATFSILSNFLAAFWHISFPEQNLERPNSVDPLRVSPVAWNVACSSTGSPSSKYGHRRTSALLRNIRNIRICMGKKPIVSVTYENERISIKNSWPNIKCVLRLSCVVHWPIYGRFMGCTVNGFLWFQAFR